MIVSKAQVCRHGMFAGHCFVCDGPRPVMKLVVIDHGAAFERAISHSRDNLSLAYLEHCATIDLLNGE